MKTHRWNSSAAWLLALSAVCTLGCYDSDETRARERQPKTSEVKRDVEQTWDDLKAYTAERRAEFEHSVSAHLSRMESELDQLGNEVADMKRDQIEPEIDGLRARLREMRTDLDELRVSAAENWEDARDKMVDAGRDLGDSLDELRVKLRT
jgi:DNA repair exonuclease SbcCD ATPase subunit